MIATCDCNHPGQDELHGKGRRVFNVCKLGGAFDGMRCTVCKVVRARKGSGQPEEKTKKK